MPAIDRERSVVASESIPPIFGSAALTELLIFQSRWRLRNSRACLRRCRVLHDFPLTPTPPQEGDPIGSQPSMNPSNETVPSGQSSA